MRQSPEPFPLVEFLESMSQTDFVAQPSFDHFGLDMNKEFYVESQEQFRPQYSESITSEHLSPTSSTTQYRHTSLDTMSDREKIRRRRIQNRISQQSFRERNKEALRKARQEAEEQKQVSDGLRLQLEDAKAELKKVRRVLYQIRRAATTVKVEIDFTSEHSTPL